MPWSISLYLDECTKTTFLEIACDFLNSWNAVSENSVIQFLKFLAVFLNHGFRAWTFHIIKKVFWLSEFLYSFIYILQNNKTVTCTVWLSETFCRKQEWPFLYTHLLYFISLSHLFYEEKFILNSKQEAHMVCWQYKAMNNDYVLEFLSHKYMCVYQHFVS